MTQIKKLIYITIAFLIWLEEVFARLTWNSDIEYKSALYNPNFERVEENSWWFIQTLEWYIIILIKAFFIFIVLYIIFKIIRLSFELYYSKNLRYLKITLPRADSKLDKEQATKKDFKEKAWIMSMFYKAIHKLAEAWLKDTLLNWIFGHSKISLELVYNKWQVTFYIVTYKNYVNLISQHLTSMYNNAEIIIVDPKKDYVNLKESWYKLRAASLWKELDDVFPIKTFKYLEDDPLNNFINVFGWLNKNDSAIYQVVIKPEGSSWNKKAMEAASLVAKWKYKKWKKWVLKFLWKPFWLLFNPVVALFQWADSMIASGNNAPWASEWDSYKIFIKLKLKVKNLCEKLLLNLLLKPQLEY